MCLMKRILSLLIFSLSLFVSSWAQQTKFDYIFQEAERQKLARNFDSAIDLFDYCRQLDPESGVVLYELADLYRYVKNDTLAIRALEKACRLYPTNYWYKNRLVSLYLENHRNDEALKNVEEMARLFPEKGEVLMMLLDLYDKKNDRENMVKVLDKIEVKEGKSEQLSMEKFRLFLQMNDEKRAFEEMKNLADEYPNDLRYQVVIGDLYLDAGKKADALKQFKMVEEKDPENVTMLLSMVNYYQMQEGQDSLYQSYLERLLTNKALDEPARVRMMAVIVRENLTANDDSTKVLHLFDKVLQQPQEETDLLELKVRYMLTKSMPKQDVEPVLHQILGIDPENDMARKQILAYAIEANDTVGVVNICKPAVEYKTNDPVFYYYLGVGYFQMKERQKALDAFKGGLERVENSDNENKLQLCVNMYALMGDIYHSLGQDDKAFQAYDSCLVYRQNDAMVLNNYAYYLSLKKKDLQRAEEMSRQSNELDPDNATYLDTLAWVLFQLKRYDEAKEYMDKAVELMEKEDEEMSEDVRQHIIQINKKTKKK
jgi:tetratricopeptide (TPR) repeat protein